MVLIHTAVKELDSDSESCSFSGLDLDLAVAGVNKKDQTYCLKFLDETLILDVVTCLRWLNYKKNTGEYLIVIKF